MTAENPPNPLADTDAVILCGGLGTRLQSVVPDRPKALALVGGRPFLDIPVDDLLDQGFRRIVFCVGHLKEQIVEHYRARGDTEYVFAQEDQPLGTGGAVANALPLTRSDPIVVINGDSFCPVDFAELYRFYCANAATAALVLTAPAGRHDGGLVHLDESNRILSFAEKSLPPTAGRFINAGIYLLQKRAIGRAALTPPFSLEHDVFPALIASERCFGFVVPGPLVDIGTPERYHSANDVRERRQV